MSRNSNLINTTITQDGLTDDLIDPLSNIRDTATHNQDDLTDDLIDHHTNIIDTTTNSQDNLTDDLTDNDLTYLIELDATTEHLDSCCKSIEESIRNETVDANTIDTINNCIKIVNEVIEKMEPEDSFSDLSSEDEIGEDGLRYPEFYVEYIETALSNNFHHWPLHKIDRYQNYLIFLIEFRNKSNKFNHDVIQANNDKDAIQVVLDNYKLNHDEEVEKMYDIHTMLNKEIKQKQKRKAQKARKKLNKNGLQHPNPSPI